jgi:outer membrane immunogenic protein
MKKLLTPIAALGLIGTPVFAADMAVKAPPPPTAPVFSWTGFYGGLNMGVSFGRASADVNYFVPWKHSLRSPWRALHKRL